MARGIKECELMKLDSEEQRAFLLETLRNVQIPVTDSGGNPCTVVSVALLEDGPPEKIAATLKAIREAEIEDG